MIYEKITEIIAEQLGLDVKGINADTGFDEINADSLEIVGIIMAIEQEFSIEVDDEDIEKMNTVGDVVEYVSNKI